MKPDELLSINIEDSYLQIINKAMFPLKKFRHFYLKKLQSIENINIERNIFVYFIFIVSFY